MHALGMMVLNAFLGAILAVIVFVALLALLLPLAGRSLMTRMMGMILTGKPERNQMLQWIQMLRLTDVETLMGIMRRAENGKPFTRPYGATRQWRPGYESLMFLPAQLNRFPLKDKDVDTRVVIGQASQKPFEIALPVMITGMAAGLSLTKAAKIALAKAASQAGTLTNSGESGFMQEERDAAKLYAVQYNRGGWNNKPEQLKQVDMIEIQFGQGADAGGEESSPWPSLSPWTRELLGLKHGEDAVIHTRFPNVNHAKDLERLVADLKNLTGGVPIAVKLAAGDIEGDLKAALDAGVDVIVIDGAQGSTGKAYYTFANDFGIPTMYAVPRADRYLRARGVRERVTLVASGGLRDTGDFLKTLALGADAVYIGLAILIAMMQAQVARVAPMAPPYELLMEKGRYANRFDPAQAERHAYNYLQATRLEMIEAVRALGHRRTADLSRRDLVALTKEAADITGVALAYRSAVDLADGVTDGIAEGGNAAGNGAVVEAQQETVLKPR